MFRQAEPALSCCTPPEEEPMALTCSITSLDELHFARPIEAKGVPREDREAERY